MTAFDHLKINKFIGSDKNLYKRFLSFVDGAKSSISVEELEEFEAKYMHKHDMLIKRITTMKARMSK